MARFRQGGELFFRGASPSWSLVGYGAVSTVQCGQGWRGSSNAYVRSFWCKNLRNFSKFMVCPHEQGEGQCRYFADEGEGSVFAIMCGRKFKREL